MPQKEAFLRLIESLESAKSSLKAAEKWAEKVADHCGIETDKIKNLAQEANYLAAQDTQDEKTVEGVFDGQNMIDAEGTQYPVPANYASKSKLIEGDRLKLCIADNGAFIYKQIELVPRTLVVGHLVIDGSQYQVLVEKNIYNVLYASVTFYRAKVGDKVTVIIPESGSARYAAIENVIPENKTEIAALEELIA